MGTFKCELLLPRPRAEVFPFFADAGNLERITPSWLSFSIVTPQPIVMTPGALIEYRLKIRGIPVRWTTKITVWEPPFRFVDEQLKGPYRKWRHEHIFEEHPQGTRAIDLVDYVAPGGWLIEKFFVRPDVERIFACRQRVLAEVFASRA